MTTITMTKRQRAWVDLAGWIVLLVGMTFGPGDAFKGACIMVIWLWLAWDFAGWLDERHRMRLTSRDRNV